MFGLDFWNVFHHLSKMETIMPKFLEPMLCSAWTFLLHLPHFKIALFFLICCHEPISNLCRFVLCPIFCCLNCFLCWLQTCFSPSHTIPLAFKSLVGISAMDCGNLQDLGLGWAGRRGFCKVTDVLSNAECAAFEELWHDDLLRLLDGHKVEGEAWWVSMDFSNQTDQTWGVQRKVWEAKYLLVLCAGDKNIEPWWIFLGFRLVLQRWCHGPNTAQSIMRFFRRFLVLNRFTCVSVCAFKCVCSVGIC